MSVTINETPVVVEIADGDGTIVVVEAKVHAVEIGIPGTPGDPATQTPWAQDVDAAGFDLTGVDYIEAATAQIGDSFSNPGRTLTVGKLSGDPIIGDGIGIAALMEITALTEIETGVTEFDALNVLALGTGQDAGCALYGVIMSAAIANGAAANCTGLNFNCGTAPGLFGFLDATVETAIGCAPNLIAFDGTVSDAYLYGGSAVVASAGEITKMSVFDFRVSAALETWGIQLGDFHSNLNGTIKLGGASYRELNAASVLLQLESTTKVLRLNRLTGTQRDALTASDGMLIYNTTTNKFQGRASGAWVDLH